MQQYSWEQPDSAQSQANDYNSIAAMQWAQRQARLKQVADQWSNPPAITDDRQINAVLPTIGQDPGAMGLNAQRQYQNELAPGGIGPERPHDQFIAAQAYAKNWLPYQQQAFQKLAFGQTPDEERQIHSQQVSDQIRQASLADLPERQKLEHQQGIYRDLQGIESAAGFNPLEALNYYDPATGQSTIPGRMMKNPDPMAEFDQKLPQFVSGPSRTVPIPDYLLKRIQDNATQLGYQPPVAAPAAGRGLLKSTTDSIPDGKTATNKATGQKMIRRNGKWVPL